MREEWEPEDKEDGENKDEMFRADDEKDLKHLEDKGDLLLQRQDGEFEQKIHRDRSKESSS